MLILRSEIIVISLLIILFVLAANGFVVPLSCFIVVWIGAIAKATVRKAVQKPL